MNLFANITHILSSDILARIAVYIDEPAENTEKAVQALTYTVMGGLMRRTTSEIGVNQLYNHIQKGRYDGSLIDNLAARPAKAQPDQYPYHPGNNVVSHLLPAMKSSIGSIFRLMPVLRRWLAIALLGLITFPGAAPYAEADRRSKNWMLTRWRHRCSTNGIAGQ